MIRVTETITLTAREHIAEQWFLDALVELEQEQGDDAGARRRQIVFSACCAESYLVEWTRELLMKSFQHGELVDQLHRYFPKPDYRGTPRAAKAISKQLEEALQLIESGEVSKGRALIERAREHSRAIAAAPIQNSMSLWQSIPRKLYEGGHLHDFFSQPPGAYPKDHVEEFRRLIEARNAVTHAGLSRPRVLFSKGKRVRATGVNSQDLLDLERGWPLRVVADRLIELHRITNTPTTSWFNEYIYCKSAAESVQEAGNERGY